MVERNQLDQNNPAPEGATDGPGSRLARWSRRKQDAREQPDQNQASSLSVETDDEQPPDATLNENPAGDANTVATQNSQLPEVEEPEEPLLCDADMPAIESLDSKSDLSCFFNRGVSEKLRQAALRHLLRLPAFNITDGLNDYDEDYTTFEPLGDIVTSDMRFHEKRRIKLAEQQRLEQEQLEEEQARQQAAVTQDEETEDAHDTAVDSADESDVAAGDNSTAEGELHSAPADSGPGDLAAGASSSENETTRTTLHKDGSEHPRTTSESPAGDEQHSSVNGVPTRENRS